MLIALVDRSGRGLGSLRPRWGCAVPGGCADPVLVLDRPAGLLVLVPFGNRDRSRSEAICEVGWSLCIPLPFGKLKGERQRVLLWVLIYVNNLLTLSVAANRVNFLHFSHVFAPLLLSRGRTQDYMELTDTYWNKKTWFMINFLVWCGVLACLFALYRWTVYLWVVL